MFLHHFHFGLVDRILSVIQQVFFFFDVALVESSVFTDYQIYAVKLERINELTETVFQYRITNLVQSMKNARGKSCFVLR